VSRNSAIDDAADAADAAMQRLEEFKLKHWAYLQTRDRPHPITGEVCS